MPLRNNQIAIVHGASSSPNELTNITFRNHAEYAYKHGYMLQEIKFESPHTGDQLWALHKIFKIPEIRRAFWIDADAVFTNPELSLTEHLPDGKVVMPYDIFGPSADCLWVENCPEVVRLLWAASHVGEWMTVWDNPGTARFKAQRGLGYLSLHPPYRALFTYVEQTVMKSHYNGYFMDGRPEDHFGRWQPGDFILHLAGIPSGLKIHILEKIL